MEAHKKVCSFFIILVLATGTKQSNENDETTAARSGRVSGRIVKLYSGVKNDPVLCPKEGFVEDPVDCTVFYRCLKATNGKFTVFRFQCGPGTVYDPETEVCNHPQNTKRSECREIRHIIDKNNKANEIETSYHEIPSPLSTKGPSNAPISANDNAYVSFSPEAAIKPSTIKPTINTKDTTPAQTSTVLISQPLISTLNDDSKKNTYISMATQYGNNEITTPSIDFPKTTNQDKIDYKGTSSTTNVQTGEACTTEGFIGDSTNCRKFYRCVSNLRGGFLRYEFLCNELTVWDEESSTCNHAWAVRNNRCGRDIINDINDMDQSNKFNNEKINYLQNPTPGYGSQAVSEGSYQQVPYGNKISNVQTPTILETHSTISPSSNTQYGARPVNEWTHQQPFSYGDKTNKIQMTTLAHTQSSISPISQSQVQPNYDVKEKITVQNYVPNLSSQSQNEDKHTSKKPSSLFDDFMQRPSPGYGPKDEMVQYQQHVPIENKINNIPTSTIDPTQRPISPSSSTQVQPSYSNYGIPANNYNPIYPSQTLNEINNSTIKPFTLGYEDIHSSDKNYLKYNQCSESGFMGDVNDCKKFYRCVDNGRGSFTRYDFTCGQGTIWDPTLEACNYEYAVKECGGKKYPEDETRYDASTSLYQTSSLSPLPSKDFSYDNVNSVVPFTTDRTKTTIRIQDDVKNKCTASGFFGIENNCKIFYRCVSNGSGGFTKVMYKCDDGYLWDSSIKSCNRAELVKSCGTPSKIIINEVKPVTTALPVLSTTTPTVHKQNDYDLGYGQRITTVNYEIIEKNPFSSTSMPQNRNNICNTAGFMGDANDCRKFYRCVDNGENGFIQYQFTCGDGTVWDSSIEACNHAWAVKNCGTSMLDTTFTSSTTSKTHVDHENVILSSTTSSVPHYEDGAYLSSNYIEMTVVPSTANGIMTEKPTSNYKNHCYKTGFVGDNNDCTKFYRCVDDGNGGFTQYQFSCGEGTVWDFKIEACNHKWAVEGCGSNTDVMKENTTGSTENEINTSQISENNVVAEYTTTQKISTPYNSEITSNNKCNKDGFMGDNNNCKKFYRCVSDGNGGYTRYEFSCGEGTIWDQEIQACNHEIYGYDCKTRNPASTSLNNNDVYTSSTTTMGETPTRPSIEDNDPNLSSPVTEVQQTSQETADQQNYEHQCSSEGFYANPDNCKKFYRCVDNGNGQFNKYEFSCGEGTAWDDSIQSCNHMDKVANCQYVPTSETDSSPVINIPMNDEQVPSNEVIQETTQSPIITSSQKSTTKQSPHNSVYTTQSPQHSSTSEITHGQTLCYEDGFFGNEEDCKKFYRCVSNDKGGFTKYDFDCGEGTIWDQEIVGCNHPQDVTYPSCKPSTENTTPTGNNDLINQETPPLSSSDQSNEVGTTTNAPHQQSSTTTSNPQTIVDQDTCEEEGFFGNKKDCKKFYRCVSNQKGDFTKYNFDCGDGTIWDQDITACNHPQDVSNPSCRKSNSSQEVDESESVTQTTSSTSSTMPTSDSGSSSTESTTSSTSESNISTQSSANKPNNNYNCTKAGFFADPNDCKKFYRCVDWDNNGERFSVYHFECGEGTIWDPALETCNHEESVYPPRNCSSQQQSDNNTTQSSTTVSQTTENIQETTTQQLATTQETTTEISSTTTTTGSTTDQSSTTQSSTPQSTTEQITTHESTTSEMTTKSSTTEQSTTTETSTISSQQTTTEASSTTETSTTTSPQTTTEPSTTTEKSTTSQQTTTTSAQSTTEQTSTTTTEQATEQSTQTEKAEDSSTTEKSTTQSTVTEETTASQVSSTTESSQESTTQTSSSNECPETNDGENLYVCPTSFRRHPKYCNMFYQCIEDDDSHELKLASFQCPNNTIYDESKTQCVEEKKADKKCNGQIATKYRVKRLNPNFKEPITVSNEKVGCSSSGHFIFEKNQECSQAFIKCTPTKAGSLRGFVYRCPEGYTYWSISRRCEAINNVRDCKHSRLEWSGRYEIPIEMLNIGPKILS